MPNTPDPTFPKSKRLRMSRKPIEKGKHWTDRDKLKVIAAFSVLGNATKVEEVTGVPANTINYWKTLPWWFEEMEKLRKSEDEVMVSGYGRIMQKTIEKLMERIENGDVVILKDGSKTTRPVSAKELAYISTNATNSRQKIRGEAIDNAVKTITMQDRLQKLNEEFVRFVKSKPVDAEIISIGDPNEREERVEEARKEGIEGIREEGNNEGNEGNDEKREEVLNAIQNEKTSEDDGSGSSQPGICEESGNPGFCSPGIQPS